MNGICVVGIGPGAYEKMTLEAVRALSECDCIVGYTVYVELVREHFPGKRLLSTPMRQEEQRCRLAFEEAQKGEKVAVICSGDAGVYGLAGLMCRMQEEYPGIGVRVIPGVTAATAGAAVLGAPLIHDTAFVSLSDLLTPWETIAKRLRLAAEADFVICLYNPGSRRRSDYLARACDLIRPYRSPDTVCGLVSRIGREGETRRLLTLAELRDAEADMFTTVYIGNSQTVRTGEWMVTPRGYHYE